MSLAFEYYDFIPRKEFKENADRVLNEICKEIPFEYVCEARCTFFANKFFFQILFKSETVTVASQTILDPKKEDTSQRDWQVRAIEHMSSHIRQQLLHFKNNTQKASTNVLYQVS
jgi:hypothetical protein